MTKSERAAEEDNWKYICSTMVVLCKDSNVPTLRHCPLSKTRSICTTLLCHRCPIITPYSEEMFLALLLLRHFLVANTYNVSLCGEIDIHLNIKRKI